MELILWLIGVLTIVLELWLGFAVAGWAGNKIVVDRSKSPGPFWVAIFIHVLIVFGIPVLVWFEYS